MRTQRYNPLCLFALPVILAVFACDRGDENADHGEHESRVDDAEHLAARYVLEDVDGPAEAEQILESIRSLERDELLDFAWWVVEHQRLMFHASEDGNHDDLLVLALAERGAENGRPFFDLGDAEVREVAQEVHRADEIGAPNDSPEPFCVWPYASCPYTTAWNGTVKVLNYMPASDWLIGYASDRTSNSACELFDCDHRLAYNVGALKRNNFFARTAAAYCVGEAYPSLLTYKSGNTQFTLVGYYKTKNCGITSGTYLHTNLALK